MLNEQVLVAGINLAALQHPPVVHQPIASPCLCFQTIELQPLLCSAVARLISYAKLQAKPRLAERE